MSKKEKFIEEISKMLEDAPEKYLSADALDFWNGLQIAEGGKPKFTENGKLILSYLKENKEVYNNLFKAKEVGEGVGISSRGASGAMRKLVNDGYIEKIGENPVVYALTALGDETDPNAEE
jgi:predicted HTH transcriptional regulator